MMTGKPADQAIQPSYTHAIVVVVAVAVVVAVVVVTHIGL
jgi:hypothetical protein